MPSNIISLILFYIFVSIKWKGSSIRFYNGPDFSSICLILTVVCCFAVVRCWIWNWSQSWLVLQTVLLRLFMALTSATGAPSSSRAWAAWIGHTFTWHQVCREKMVSSAVASRCCVGMCVVRMSDEHFDFDGCRPCLQAWGKTVIWLFMLTSPKHWQVYLFISLFTGQYDKLSLYV